MNSSSTKNISFKFEEHDPLILSWYDYISFTMMLGICSSAGIYYGCFKNKQRTVNEYLLGNKKFSALPIALSVAIGHYNSIAIVTVPADVYKYGAYYIFCCISLYLIAISFAYIYLPVFFEMKLTSAYEYLERRFDKKTKLLISTLYVYSEIIVIAASIYTPSLALSTATGLRTNLISSAVCAVCIFYTMIGGLKVVVWTDFFQLAVIIGTMLVVCVIGTISSGGISFVINKANEGGRLDIFDLDPNPTRRDSFWVYVIGYTVHFLSYLCLTQSGLQKFIALPTYKDCVWSLIYMAICMNIVFVLLVFSGLLIYSKYSDCDLLKNNKIERHEQILTYYVMDVTRNIPGISGCLLVTVFCASLSTISSALNALSGVIFKDFFSVFLDNNVTDKKAIQILKLIVLFLGIFGIGLALFIQHLGNVLPFVASTAAIARASTLGVFTLGLLYPQANRNGAFYGAIGGTIFTAFLALPIKYYFYYKLFSYPSKPIPSYGCTPSNDTFNETLIDHLSFMKWNTTEDITKKNPLFIFRISHFYHTLFGALFTIILGILISFVTRRKNNNSFVDKTLISPICRRFVQQPPTTQEIHTLLKTQSVDE